MNTLIIKTRYTSGAHLSRAYIRFEDGTVKPTGISSSCTSQHELGAQACAAKVLGQQLGLDPADLYSRITVRGIGTEPAKPTKANPHPSPVGDVHLFEVVLAPEPPPPAPPVQPNLLTDRAPRSAARRPAAQYEFSWTGEEGRLL